MRMWMERESVDALINYFSRAMPRVSKMGESVWGDVWTRMEQGVCAKTEF